GHLCCELDRTWDPWSEHIHDEVPELVLPVLHSNLVQLDQQVVVDAALVAKARRRNHDQPVIQVRDRLRILVAEGLAQPVRRAARGRPIDGRWICGHHEALATSAQTVMERNVAGPKVVIIATSRASRPRPMSTRPTRRALLRGSNVHQRSPSQTSIHAAKSIGAGSGGTYRSGR